MASSSAPTTNFPELKVSDTYDMCIENTIKKLAYGALGGGLAALIMFRTGTPRAATFGLGAGLGVGMGYAECKFAFDSITKEATK